MSVGWYNSLKDLATAFECPDDAGRARFIDGGCFVAGWSLFACVAFLLICCTVRADLYYIIFGNVAVFLFALLLFTLEDWRFYLSTKKNLKQRVKDWFLYYWTTFRSTVARFPEYFTRKAIVQEPHATNGREKTPSPIQPPTPPAFQPPSGLESIRRDLRDILNHDNNPSDQSVAPSQPESSPPRRIRTRSVSRQEQQQSSGVPMSTTTQQQPMSTSGTIPSRRSTTRSNRGR